MERKTLQALVPGELECHLPPQSQVCSGMLLGNKHFLTLLIVWETSNSQVSCLNQLLTCQPSLPNFFVNYAHFLFSIFNLSLLCPRIWLSLVYPKKESSTAFPGHYSSSWLRQGGGSRTLLFNSKSGLTTQDPTWLCSKLFTTLLLPTHKRFTLFHIRAIPPHTPHSSPSFFLFLIFKNCLFYFVLKYLFGCTRSLVAACRIFAHHWGMLVL